MALEAQQALLDELLGRNRNDCNGQNTKPPHWSDEEVCKYFLCNFCPHELFVNTKTDLGPCTRTHDERMRENYKESKRCGTMGYEESFAHFLNYLIEDVDKRIRRGHERLAVNKHVNNPEPSSAADKKDKIASLTKRTNDLIKQAEQLGTEGKVDQAQGVLKLCEQLKFERSLLEGDARPGMSQSKELEVCEICGAFRIKDDAPQRVEEHLTGKMHLGYAKIRDYLRQYSEQSQSRSPNRYERSGGGSSSNVSRYSRYREQRNSSDHRRSPRDDHSRSSRSSHHRRDDSSSRHHHRSSGHRHDRRSDRTRRSRSRSRRRDRDHRRHESSKSSSRRDTSPFSAARRPPEGAEDY